MISDFRDIVNSLDRDEEVHLARIIILISAFTEHGERALNGITKLAKLDFLLRYPNALERALKVRNIGAKSLEIEDYEKLAVEASMIRYRYGPWDHRYRRFLNILTAKKLTYVSYAGRTINIHITSSGKSLAAELAELEEFGKINRRAKILAKHFDKSPSWLTDFVYSTFPEITETDFNEDIWVRE